MALQEEILKRLREAAPASISGQVLAESLGLSRAAVWKAVCALRRKGYGISSSSRVGYRLDRSPDLLFPAEIGQALATRSFGREGIHFYLEIGSTNDRAREIALAGSPEGTLVVAERQHSGRGRLGRRWESPGEGGLYFSLLLRPPFPPSEAPRITLLAGVGVCRAIKAMAPVQAAIKWPNDILIQGRKAAGILTEMEAEADRIHHVILGIGVNVNTPIGSLPRELRKTATSLLEETGRPVPRSSLLGRILLEIESLYQDLIGSGFGPILEAWRGLNLTLGRRVRVERAGGAILGEAMDIDDQGRLIVKEEKGGALHRISSGEVTLLRGAL